MRLVDTSITGRRSRAYPTGRSSTRRATASCSSGVQAAEIEHRRVGAVVDDVGGRADLPGPRPPSRASQVLQPPARGARLPAIFGGRVGWPRMSSVPGVTASVRCTSAWYSSRSAPDRGAGLPPARPGPSDAAGAQRLARHRGREHPDGALGHRRRPARQGQRARRDARNRCSGRRSPSAAGLADDRSSATPVRTSSRTHSARTRTCDD